MSNDNNLNYEDSWNSVPIKHISLPLPFTLSLASLILQIGKIIEFPCIEIYLNPIDEVEIQWKIQFNFRVKMKCHLSQYSQVFNIIELKISHDAH